MLKYYVWTERGNVRILADEKIEDLKSKECKIIIEGARGECESAQIIISAVSDIRSYDIQLSHVNQVKEGQWIWSDCWTVYNEKYIRVDALNETDKKFPEGLYPDALLPFEKAKEYKETFVLKGNNQGIWLTLKIPENQVAGDYSGEFTLNVDGDIIKIPVCVRVWDFNIPKKVHLQSDIGVEPNQIKLGENDYFPDMVRKYTERLISFRLSPSLLAFKVNKWHSGDEFAAQVRLFCKDDKPYLSTVMIPVEEHPETGLDKKRFAEMCTALMKAAVEDGINYLERAAVFCNFIDEPQLNGTWDEANLTSKNFESLKYQIADEFYEKSEKTHFVEEVCNAMRNVKNFVTIHVDEKLTEVKNYCPAVSKMSTPELRAQYKDKYIWWYTCGAGDEVPSWVINRDILGIRLMPWMSYDYDIHGILYWESCIFSEWKFCMESHLNHETLIDCYKVSKRSPSCSGDGYLFYPGRPYGIYGPVESIRLHVLRDGMEDYEYLYLYGQLCEKAGLDVHKEIRELCDKLYEDITIKADCKTFDIVRRSLAEKIVELKKQLESKIE